jgi:hypothetical protein
MSHFLPLEACFSFLQHTRKRKPVLEGCFSVFFIVPTSDQGSFAIALFMGLRNVSE